MFGSQLQKHVVWTVLGSLFQAGEEFLAEGVSEVVRTGYHSFASEMSFF